ncbi:MAG: DUF4258 domain-containing protein [candidate division NC10 bacterium]|nr:DUF4258 domain-containing protein [candidate division NC10 bacterium]
MVRAIIRGIHDHPQGREYHVAAGSSVLRVLLTFHALDRMGRWGLTDRKVVQALLGPEEVLRGHRGRFIAHRRSGEHVVRVVDEYQARMPVVITVYCPYAERYFRGGGTYEDRVCS